MDEDPIAQNIGEVSEAPTDYDASAEPTEPTEPLAQLPVEQSNESVPSQTQF